METDASGNVVQSCTYAPFGQVMSCSPDDSANHYRFTGQERDAETGLDNFRARHYTGQFGRFLQPDPAGLAAVNMANPQSWNRYAYVGGNPVSAIDPTGMHMVLCATSASLNGVPVSWQWYWCEDPDAPPDGSTPVSPFGLGWCVDGYADCDGSGDGGGGGGGGDPLRGVVPSINQNIEKFLCDQGLAMAKQDMSAVNRAKANWSMLQGAAALYGTDIDPAMLAAIGVRETGFQNVLENGFNWSTKIGQGIFQISDPTMPFSCTMDAFCSATYAASLLSSNMGSLAAKYPSYAASGTLLQATAASYNFGVKNLTGNPDTIDWGTMPGGRAHPELGNYGSSVVSLMNCF